jgi:hypothetical protein
MLARPHSMLVAGIGAAQRTKHTNFAESTEAVLNLVCAECGKPCRFGWHSIATCSCRGGPARLATRCLSGRTRREVRVWRSGVCRSATEKDLHTKRTGHATFEDKTNDVSNVATVRNVSSCFDCRASDHPRAGRLRYERRRRCNGRNHRPSRRNLAFFRCRVRLGCARRRSLASRLPC